ARAVEVALRDGNDSGEIALARREKAGGLIPLSFAQQRMWFLDQLEPGNPFYNISAAVRLSGRLNVAALERRFQEILKRHEALRTIFTLVDGQVAQVITPSMSAPLRVEDLSPLAEGDLEPEVVRRAEEEAQRGFDLARGALARLRLLRLREQEHVALLTM